MIHQTSNIIGTLCQQIHPEAGNETEAVDIERSELYKRIQLKLDNEIKAADDIELYFVLGSAYEDLRAQQFNEELNRRDK